METSFSLFSVLNLFAYVTRASGGLSDEQVLATPPGLRNNIVWNVGHLVVDNCDMLYRPAGLAPPHPDSFIPLFAAGTSPSDWKETPSPAEVMGAFAEMSDRLKTDMEEDRFRQFDPGQVVSGWPVKDFDQTLAYVANHTGIHLGVIMTLRRLVS